MHHLHGHLNLVQSLGLYLHACLCELTRMCSVVQVVDKAEEQQQPEEASSGGGGHVCAPRRVKSVEKCVVMDEEGGKVVKRRWAMREVFAYMMVVAFEAGSPLRGLVLLMWWPMIWAVSKLVSEWAAMRMMVMVATAGLRECEVAGVGRAVLPRFFFLQQQQQQDDHLHHHHHPITTTTTNPSSSQSSSSCCCCCCCCCVVLTSFPRLLVQPFLLDYLGARIVLAPELSTFRGFCTGLLLPPSLHALNLLAFPNSSSSSSESTFPDLPRLASLSLTTTTTTFLSLCCCCKEGGSEVKSTTDKKQQQQSEEAATHKLRRPLIFHDGRLVMRPTPLVSLFIYLWLPVGFGLAIVRLIVWCLLPAEVSVPLSALLGVRLRVKGSPPLATSGDNNNNTNNNKRRGMLYVCTHRTLLDPIFLSVALRRPVTAVTYSLSRLSELLSPIKTVRLSRRRDADAETIDSLLRQGDLIICPEGTTCREPYLLRFSPLFAEITHDIVPVGISVHMSIFHGTTARGLKAMDPFFFLMNPTPSCSITILDPLPPEETCASGRSSVEVANRIQKRMGDVMGYECTNLTRRDKYRVLAGNDGVVPTAPAAPSSAPIPITPTSTTPAANYKWTATLLRSIRRSPVPRHE